MAPALNDGDVVLYNPRSRPRTGDIVFAAHPYKQSVSLLKRVGEINTEGKLFLAGDNAESSTDSRSLGLFSRNDIKGRVVCRLK